MKIIGIILSASALALLAVASFTSPAKPGRDASNRDPLYGARQAFQSAGGRRSNAAFSNMTLSSLTWQKPIAGSRVILAARFVPVTTAVVAPIVATALPQDDALRGETDEVEPSELPAMTVHWTLPLISRFITGSRRLESMAPDMQDAINRIEPMFDPTRLDGLYTDSVSLHVTAGTAWMSDIFGEHWHLASDDPNVNAKVPKIGMAWLKSGAPASCEAFTKNRQHDFGEPTLTNLDEWDCLRLKKRQALHFNDAAPVPLVVAPLSVPVFAAPMPGSRMSSQDFWAAQRARINAIQAKIRRKWQEGAPTQAATSPRTTATPVKVSSNR